MLGKRLFSLLCARARRENLLVYIIKKKGFYDEQDAQACNSSRGCDTRMQLDPAYIRFILCAELISETGIPCVA